MKWMTRQMLGLKSFNDVQSTLTSIELHKDQSDAGEMQ